nr:uridine diphosphate-N-acetylglucosamine-binding protein YvcK [Nocardioides jejuensis]
MTPELAAGLTGQPILPDAVVALGGGHGLSASLAALRRVVDDLTAVVTVADNGGSSGRLREEFGVLPPGDLRMALAALCGDDEWGQTWAKVLQHRFAGEGEMKGHSLGNLLIVALWEQLGEHVDGLDWVGRLLDARGRVLPMTLAGVDLCAEVIGHDPTQRDARSTVRGQVQVATTPGRITSVSLDPATAPACPEAVAAVLAADWIVLGPGSWYSSVIPHLLVPELRQALVETDAKILVVLNLGEQKGETDGYAPEDHVAALLEHAPGLRIHTVLADVASVPDPVALEGALGTHGAQLVLAEVAVAGSTTQHDPVRLADAYARIFGGVESFAPWR